MPRPSRHPLRDASALAAAALLGALLVAACDTTSTPAAAPSGDASEVTVRVGDGATLDEVLARHRGKVVLVDFWATWCGPCRAQFPHTVALHRQHAERGLAVVSVSLDNPDDATVAKVRAFLQAQGATFDNIVSRFGLGTESVEAFELRGDVPFYRLYDRSGTLRYQLSADPEGLEKGEPTAAMDRRVEELLAES